MLTAGLLLLFAAIAALDVPALLRRRSAKSWIVYGAIFLLALVLSELQVLRVPLWSANRTITDVFGWFGM
ncbi:hypothetical protein [Paenibacillus sp.]|uniref:hypothetical protein n=1 Tax=Paenibacillus sp. TaxID=58172 RepID=UPI002D550CB3|nr:hypothetical protein [Paenibacillus sp.]HZG58813.1 hypothetical protein [Paenibacillus sp.]